MRTRQEWKNIDGIAYIEDEKVKTTRMRPLIQDLDELPFMATDFLEELQLKHGKNVTAYLVSSRGCYKNCSFYSIAAYFDMFEGCRMRYRSVKSVFEEIKYLYQNYNIRKFCFGDDNFIIPGKRGIERCRELVELIKSLPEKISLELETRVDTISYEAISLLKEGGLRHIHIGIESMIDRDLKLYNKGVTIKQNKEALNMTYWYRKGKVHHEKYAHRTWEATTIKTILANQMYTGDMVQGKKQKCIAEGRNTQKKQKEEDYVIVPNTHEALIDRSLFDKVQKICREELEANREKRKKYTDISSTEDLLKNKIFSAEGLKMYRGRNVYKNERVTYNYVTSKSRKNDGTYYKFVYISEEKVFQALKKAIYFYIELLFSIENSHMDRKRKEKAEIEQKQLKKEIANSQKNVEWYTRRLADTYKEKTEGKIQMEDYIKKQTEYRACKEAAQEKIKELSDKYEIYKMQLLGNPDYFAVYETFLKTEELNKMLIDVLVKKITVAENAKIEITFQFEDEMRMLYERLKESCSA